ncbi:MAG: DUF1013 domain-containing protein [Micavibrio aeruginosavorus]|uniref:DUF1013 domain-containing protein n=1 Tax=Micavibrio aeruginosavorus TaxID=349221 RepID=A0A2W5FIW0_9BACT|nr:MAG: DUF1013 domain-containing protein [Micavibrio aeruginosavorus]
MALTAQPKPMKPKATAVWLVEHTGLTFEQIGDFTGLHSIEVQALADEEVGRGIIGEDPIKNGELTLEEIARCEKDSDNRLKMSKDELPSVKQRAKGPRYTPVSRRNDKPDAIAYILKTNPEISDAQICKLVGTTKPTIQSVRDRSHPASSTMRPRHPAEIGLCTYEEYDKASRKGLKAQGKDPDAEQAKRVAELTKQQDADYAAQQEADEKKSSGGFDFSNFFKGSGTN